MAPFDRKHSVEGVIKMLRLENLKKSYDGKTVLKDISLQIDDGEIVSILGPSGCGGHVKIRLS